MIEFENVIVLKYRNLILVFLFVEFDKVIIVI